MVKVNGTWAVPDYVPSAILQPFKRVDNGPICMNCGRGEWKHCGDAGCHKFQPFPSAPKREPR